jgi:hypothetical protein
MANVDQAAVQQVAGFKSAKQRTAYCLLNDDEKAYFWQYKLSVMKETPGLNNVQLTYLNNLSGLLVPSLFKTGTKENKTFKKQQLQELEQNGLKIFTHDALKFILAGKTFSKIPLGRLSFPAKPDSSGGSCDCNIGSMADCLGGGWPTVCDVSGCSASTFGCGAFGIFNCNGNCRDVAYTPTIYSDKWFLRNQSFHFPHNKATPA